MCLSLNRGGLVVWPIVSQVEGRGFKPRLAPPDFSKFLYEIKFDIHHEFCGEV